VNCPGKRCSGSTRLKERSCNDGRYGVKQDDLLPLSAMDIQKVSDRRSSRADEPGFSDDPTRYSPRVAVSLSIPCLKVYTGRSHADGTDENSRTCCISTVKPRFRSSAGLLRLQQTPNKDTPLPSTFSVRTRDRVAGLQVRWPVRGSRGWWSISCRSCRCKKGR
jgi:hypothetical protein